ncbi:MAG: glycoside hydrolase, partial [Cyanobacteria bacterium J06641_5]
MTSKQYQGIVVAHTHWDRAWYLPFQRYRQRLVRLLDRLMAALEADPAFRAFTLDGQTVLLEDYLEIRPEQKSRLQALVQAGRLAIGPWYALPDLFLVNGEAIVRNLQVGLAMVAEYGGSDCVGYVPDPFGHCAQMPQILQGLGLDAFVFMRGLSAEA